MHFTGFDVGEVVASLGGGITIWRYVAPAIKNMPPPITSDSRWWYWVFNTLQDWANCPENKVRYSTGAAQ